MAVIGLLYAGGTFGCHGMPLVTMTADDFLPKFLKYYAVSIISNDLVKDSSCLTPQDFLALYRTIINSNFKKIVLITGTDTLAYLSAFLYYALKNTDICLNITGAMLPFFEPTDPNFIINANTDAKANFENALAFLAQGKTGVYVSFDNNIYVGNSIQKMHTSAKNAFVGKIASINTTLSSNKPLTTTVYPNIALSDDFTIHSIYCLPNNADELTRQLTALNDHPPSAVIIIGFGAGNMPYSADLAHNIERLSAKGFLLIITSSCAFGAVSQTYETGAWQYNNGALSGGELSIPAIYAKALWLCASLSLGKRQMAWKQEIYEDT